MSPRYLIAAAFVLMTAAYADAGQARVETNESTPADQGERAVPRAQPRNEPAARPAPQPQQRNEPERAQPRTAQPRSESRPVRREPPARTAPPRVMSAEAPPQEQAVPRGSRPQGDNPRTGTAVPRGEGRPPVTGGGGGGGDRDNGPTIIVRRPPVYNYYYPQRYYPYGYGGFGLGYFYYDPYTWYPGSYGYYGSSRYGYGRYPGRSFSTFDTGELRLRVSPRDAQVFIDGYYAGVVDDYDGTFQALRLEEGPYTIEIVAPGYRPLEFDVRIIRGRKITYRGDLERP